MFLWQVEFWLAKNLHLTLHGSRAVYFIWHRKSIITLCEGSCELLSPLSLRRPSVNFSHFNQLLWRYWANLNQALVEWFLDGPLPKLCPVIPTSNQDGHQAKNRKRGMKFKKIFSSETTEPISTKLQKWSLGGPFQYCVRERRPVSKMATITKNRNFFKWPKLLYFKPESSQIWTV